MASTELQKMYDGFSTKFFYDTYSKDMYSWHYFIMKHLHDAFVQGRISGKTYLDVGAGPSIYTIASAGKFCDQIVTSDFSDTNIRQLELWVNNDKNAFDWTVYFRYCAELEGFTDLGAGAAEIEERLRKKIKEIRHCDVTKSYPLEGKCECFDIVVNSFCLESATVTEEEYIAAVKNISNLVNPGGNLVMSGSIGSTWYIVDNIRFPSMPLSEELITKALNLAEMTLDIYQQIEISEFVDVLFDGRYNFFCIASKNLKTDLN